MCDFFSCWATRDGRLLFCEDNSHDETARRAGLRDYHGHAVKIEVTPSGDGWGPVQVDESTTPAWWVEDQAAWEDRVLALADRVRSARASYDKTTAPARAAHREVLLTAWAVFHEATGPTEADWHLAPAMGEAAYDKVAAAAEADYDKASAAAWAACRKTTAPAQATFVAALRTIDGYVADVERP